RFGPHGDDQVTRGDLAAFGDVHLLHDAAGRGGDIHRGLLGLQSDQRSLRLDRLAGLDENVDNGDVLEVAHVGHTDFYEARCRVHRFGASTLSRVRAWTDRRRAP